MNAETKIQTDILLAMGQFPSVRIWRCNTGNAVAGARYIRIDKPTTVTLQPGDWIVKRGSRVQYGLCNGGSDLIGLRQVPGPNGPIAQFCAIEVKTETGPVTKEQANFIEVVRSLGGHASVARSAEEAVAGVVCGEML